MPNIPFTLWPDNQNDMAFKDQKNTANSKNVYPNEQLYNSFKMHYLFLSKKILKLDVVMHRIGVDSERVADAIRGAMMLVRNVFDQASTSSRVPASSGATGNHYIFCASQFAHLIFVTSFRDWHIYFPISRFSNFQIVSFSPSANLS